MKPIFSRLFSLALLLAMLMTRVSVIPVYAAPAITSVVPNQIVNNVSNTITLNGSGFASGSPVVLLNGSALSTTLVNDTVLTAVVPAGVGAGTYDVAVSNGTDPIVTCSSCLTVVVPTPIPPTLAPTATSEPLPFVRPQFVVRTSRATKEVQYKKQFTLKVVLENVGQSTAYSAQAVFASPDLIPTNTGGVAVLGVVPYDDEVNVNQTFYVSTETYGKPFISVDMTITYYDDKANSYTDKFTLSIPVTAGAISSGVVYPTATPTGVKSSQLVITSYAASIDPLQPGEQFALNLQVENVGNVKAQRITMIVGGGSSGSTVGTPQPGGVSGGSGDFANFAPVGASNVQSLGDLVAGESIKATQNLIVNVNTNPGAYPMRISFSYLNDKSEAINDEQVITLLVYSLPNLDVSFYRPPDPFSVGQPGALPIQVVNLGKRLSVLGNMKVSAKDGAVENGTSLIGSLDAGGYFTLDSFFTPQQSGSQSLEVTIEYVDDFNQPRTITKTLDVEVMEGFVEPTPDPSFGDGGGGGGGEPVDVEPETTLHKVFRFIKGLLGLDSSWPVWQAPSGSEQPPSEESVPVRPAGKGG